MTSLDIITVLLDELKNNGLATADSLLSGFVSFIKLLITFLLEVFKIINKQ
jgi:hypothetical protein